MNVLDAQAFREHLGVDGVTGIGVRGEHFASDLSVSWLVGAYQAKLVAGQRLERGRRARGKWLRRTG